MQARNLAVTPAYEAAPWACRRGRFGRQEPTFGLHGSPKEKYRRWRAAQPRIAAPRGGGTLARGRDPPARQVLGPDGEPDSARDEGGSGLR